MSAPKNVFLVVDPDQIFLRSLLEDPKSKLHPPLTCDSGSTALAAIRSPDHKFHAILVNLNVAHPDGRSVINGARQNHPDTPIIILQEKSDRELPPEMLKALRVDGTVRKPLKYHEFIKAYLAPADLFDPKDLAKHANQDQAPAGTEVERQDAHFVAIAIDQFICGSKSLFDVYIRLQSGKYLKILKSGDAFTPDQSKKYKDKGATHFYLRAESHPLYMSFVDKIVSQAIGKSDISIEAKVQQSLSHGQRILDSFMKKDTLNGADTKFALSYVDSVTTLIKDLDLAKQSQLIETLLQNNSTLDHSTATTLIAGLVAREMGFETHKSIRLIGIAAFLHDIALIGQHTNAAIMGEDESKMNDSELKFYKSHPIRGSKILSELRGVDAAAAQAVANHHRRRDGTGFPNSSGIGSAPITLPAEILGLADEFVRFQFAEKGNKKDKKEAMAVRLKNGVFIHFSADIVVKLAKVTNLKLD